MADPMCVLELVGLAGQMRLERGLQLGAVLVMDTIEPFRDGTDARGRGQAKHRPPSARAVELLAPKIPLPQPVVRAFRCEREPLLAALERLFRARPLRDVIPEQRRAAGNGEDFDLERAAARGGWQRKMREGPRRAACSALRRSLAGAGSCPAPASPQRVSDRAPVHVDSRECVRAQRSRA